MSKMDLRWLLVVAMLLLAACGSTATSGTTVQKFTMTASEFAFGPTALEVTSGQPVEITLQNTGAIEHDFSIQGIELADKPSARGDTHASGGHMADQPKLHVAAAAGSRGTVIFTPTTPGQYQFYCSVAGHKEAGMVGVLTVKTA